ncbi:unnamed protein product [Closterium sp. Naga37s-1]|nr:unnamed protein product [Closterium sp. Naga37s-1]
MTGASGKSQRASRATRHEEAARQEDTHPTDSSAPQEPQLGDSAGREASSAPKESTLGGSHRGDGGLDSQRDQPERLGRVEEVTEEQETSWGEAAAAVEARENGTQVTESEAAAVAEAAGTAVPEVVAAAATVVAPASVGGPDAASVGGGAGCAGCGRETQWQAQGEAELVGQEADGEEEVQSLVEERRSCDRERGGNATIALNRWQIL